MTIYQGLQVNAAGSKKLIQQAENRQEKWKWIGVYLLKIILTVIFCFTFVTVFSLLCGSENSIAGVTILLVLLAVRQADFGIKVSHGVINLFMVFIIFITGPKLTNMVPALPALLINIICISGMVFLGCHNVIMSNQFTFVLSYLLLQGYDVTGREYGIRVIALLFGAVFCCFIFWIRHRKIVYKRTWRDVFHEFDIHTQRTKWQLKFILGISLGMFLASLLHFPRVMWVGISIMSLLVPFYQDTIYRAKRRAPFNIVGCLLFFILYTLLPQSLYPYMGIIGGIGVGLSAGYPAQTVFNVLGALSIAVGMFGLYGAIIIRILANVLGTVFTLVYQRIYESIVKRIKEKNRPEEIVQV